MITLETQEVGTGKWFPITQFVPGTPEQRESADEKADILKKVLGLHVRVVEDAKKDEVVSDDGKGHGNRYLDELGDQVQELAIGSKANVVGFVLFEENGGVEYRSRLSEETLRKCLLAAAEVL